MYPMFHFFIAAEMFATLSRWKYSICFAFRLDSFLIPLWNSKTLMLDFILLQGNFLIWGNNVSLIPLIYGIYFLSSANQTCRLLSNVINFTVSARIHCIIFPSGFPKCRCVPWHLALFYSFWFLISETAMPNNKLTY